MKTLNNTPAAITLNTTTNDVDAIDLQTLNAAGDTDVAGAITFVDEDGVTINQIATTSTISVTAGDIIDILGPVSTAGAGTIGITATGSAINIGTTFDGTITAENGDITLTGSDVTLGGAGTNFDGIVTTAGGIGNIKIDASGAVLIADTNGDTSMLDAGGYLDIDPTTVTINGGGVEADEYVSIAASGAVTNNSTILTTDNDSYVTITAGSIVQDGNITTPTAGGFEYVTLDSNGSITDTTDATTDISTVKLNITDGTTIGADTGGDQVADSTWLNTDVAGIELSNIDSNVFVDENDALGIVGIDTGGVFELASGGAVSVTGAVAADGGFRSTSATVGSTFENTAAGTITTSGNEIYIEHVDEVEIHGKLDSGDGNSADGGNITVKGKDTDSSGVGLLVDAIITTKSGAGGSTTIGGGVDLRISTDAGFGDINLQGGGSDTVISADLGSWTAISITADRDIDIKAKLETFAAYDISITADYNDSGEGGVRIQDAGQVVSGKNITITGSDFFGLGAGSTGNSVLVVADSGAANQVQANGNIIIQNSGIGLLGEPNADIALNGLVAATSTTGTIDIYSADQILLDTDLTSAGGKIQFHDAVALNGDSQVSTGAGSGNVLFDSTVGIGVNKLTLNSGSGNITLSDTLSGTGTLEVTDGATQNYDAMTLGSLDIKDAGSDVIFNGAVSATTIAVNSSDEISQAAGGSLTAATSITLDAINGIGDSGAGEAIVVSSPSITATNTNSSGAIALESADSLSVGDKGSGATLGISQASGGVVEVTATGGSNIDVDQTLTVGGSGRIVLDADTGSITESGGKLNTQNLELLADAGITANILSLSSVNLAAQIAAGGSGIDITSQVLGGDLTVANVAGISGITGISSSGSNINLTETQGNLVVNQGVDAGTGAIAVTANNGTLTNNSSITGSGGITLTSDSMALDSGSVSGGAGIVNLLQKTNGQAIDLGTQDGSNLELTNAELNTVTADTLRIGNVNTGEITVTGNVDVTANVSNVKLTSGEGISHSGTAAITAGALALSAENTIDLLTKVDTLAAETTLGGITVENTMVSGLTVGTVDGIVGIDTSNTALNLTETTGNITVAQAVNANSNTATITATAGNVNLNQQVNVGSGTVNVNTGGAVVLNSNINAAGGTVNITAAGRINNPSGVITANTTTLESTGAGIGIDNTINTATYGTLTLESGGNASAGDINVVESVITNTNKVGFTTNGTGNQNISLTFTGGTLTVGGNIGNETDNLSIKANTGDMLDGGGVITANDLELTVLGNGANIGTAPVWNAQHTRIDTPSVPVRIVVQGTNNGLTVDASNGNGGIFLTVPESPVTANPNRPEELAAYQDQMSYNSLRYTTIDAGEGGDIGLTMTGWLDGAVNPDVYDEDGTTIGDNIFQPTNLPEYTNSIDSWRDAGETGPIPDNYIRGDELMIEVGTIGLSAAPQADVQTIRLTVNDKGEHPVSTIPGDWSALIVVEDLYDTGGRLLDYPVPVNQLNATRPGNVRIGSGLVTPEQDFVIPLSVQSAAAAIPVFSPQQQSLEKLLSSAGGEDFFMTPPLWIDINMGGDEDFEEEDFGGEDEFSSNQRPYYYGTPDLMNVVDMPTLLGANQELGQGLLRLSALN